MSEISYLVSDLAYDIVKVVNRKTVHSFVCVHSFILAWFHVKQEPFTQGAITLNFPASPGN